MSTSFKQIYLKNSSTPHEYWGQIAEGIFKSYPQERICLKGNVSEIARCYYGPYSNKQMSFQKFCIAVKIQDNFLKKSIKHWYERSIKVCKENNIDITDLYYWEIRMGRWQAISQLEWDIAQEAFTPYNCRPLLENMLSSQRKYRQGPDYKLHREIIKHLWKSGLLIPINPDKDTLIFKLLYRIKILLIKSNMFFIISYFNKLLKLKKIPFLK